MLDEVALLSSSATPILVRAFRNAPGDAPSFGTRSRPFYAVLELDRHLDVLAREVDAHPADYKDLLWNETNVIAARLGIPRTLELLGRFLDDSSPTYSTVNGYRMRICDEAAEKIERLAGADLGRPDLFKPAKTQEWDACVERARAWLRANANAPTLERQSWVLIRTRGLAVGPNPYGGKCSRLETTLRLSPRDRSSYGYEGDTRAFQSLGPFASGKITGQATDKVANKSVDLALEVPERGVVWVDVDMAKGTAAVEVEPR